MSDAFNLAITIIFQFQQNIINCVIPNNTLDDGIGGYLNVELIELAINMKWQVILVLDPFLSFLWRFKLKKAHNMLCFMLDPQYKNLHLMSSFIRRDIGRLIVNEYDEKSLLLMLLKCYEHSHEIFGTLNNSQFSEMDIDPKCSLDIFEMGSWVVNLCRSVSIKNFCYFDGFRLM